MKKEIADKETKHHDNSFGVAGVVLGILSLVLVMIPFIGLILGIVGVFFAYRQRKVMNNKWAVAGLWLCGIGIVAGAVWAVYYVKITLQIAAQYQSQLDALQQAGQAGSNLASYGAN